MTQVTPKTTDSIIKLLNELAINSSRLSLKKFSKAEVEHNVKHEMDPELMRYIRDITSLEQTRQKTLAVVEPYSGNEGDWYLVALRLLADMSPHCGNRLKYL